MSEHEHCPFCDENMPYLTPKELLGKKGWRMFCGRCGAYGGWGETGEEAEALWNTRKGEPRKICANCKYIKFYSDNGCLCNNPDSDYYAHPQNVCPNWEGVE